MLAPQSVTVPLTAHGLTKSYNRDAPALSEIYLEVGRGQCVSLIGPNGAGKSTLLRTWMGFERPSSGLVSVFGADPQRRRAEAIGHIAYVGQGTPLIGRLSALDHLTLAATFRRSTDTVWARRRLTDLALPERRPVQTLSGGQRAQVALTLALALRADIILLDEPLSSLDPLARRHFMAEALSRAQETGSTLVLASHAIGDIDPNAGRLIVLAHGRVALDMPTVEARRRHRVLEAAPVSLTTRVIGDYQTLDGSPRYLVVCDEDGDPLAPLEDVVLGYLAGAQLAT